MKKNGKIKPAIIPAIQRNVNIHLPPASAISDSFPNLKQFSIFQCVDGIVIAPYKHLPETKIEPKQYKFDSIFERFP